MEKKYNFHDIRAIIGLGNPGVKYAKTRHNVGFCFVDLLAEWWGVPWNSSNELFYATVMLPDRKPIYLVKPLTFMNNSGRVLSFLLKKGIKGEELLVVHDELEKPFGKFGAKWAGSSRGHNGLRSIESVIGKEYWRLWFGIGRPEHKEDVGNYVLSSFTQEEEGQLEDLLKKAVILVIGESSPSKV